MKPWHLGILITLSLALAPRASADFGKNETLVNPNQAGPEDLQSLPHLGDESVATIIENRPFLSTGALDELLTGALDEAQREELYGRLFVPLDLNSASREEILLIPGVGKRIAHEFEEYRPYENMARFRREIGKYLDEDEIARLEQYVFVPIDLNEASDDEILAIPGLGRRLLHEFKEYRPYVNLDQFRREIGKYVDDVEVARLERYVTIAAPPSD